MKRHKFFLFAASLLFAVGLASAAAMADDYVLSPENCPFEITLPEEPYQNRKCSGPDQSNCQPYYEYIKVFGGISTVFFSVACNTLPAGAYKQYDDQMLNAALRAIANSKNLEDVETGISDIGDVRHAVVIGTATDRRTDIMHIGQLWVAEGGVMTVAGELRGPAAEEADNLLARILQSIQHVDWADDAETEDESAEESGKQSNSEE